ncbi:hypothetical protein HK15_03445 [Acetobacter orientalis]|uniref:Uncharacterized protein n=1 Tax=Acetobacter orientalis TaxID=146474 RepID=A0A252AZK6_9PROT|nr:hypothetical protein [Acetobacter orientalis]OUI97444.1 hypothetical protein HK15_03445 [Acetobacter orientalis]
MVYKLPPIYSSSSIVTRALKIVPALGLLACCAVSPAFAGEAVDDATNVQMHTLQATLENARHIDAQTTKMDELIRLQARQEKALEQISDNLRILVHVQIGKVQQDAQSSSRKLQGH